MSKLINQQDAINLVEDIKNKRLKGEIDLAYPQLINCLMAMSFTELTRCKDCKYYKAPERTWYGDTKRCTYSALRSTKPDDFCSKAERKEE